MRPVRLAASARNRPPGASRRGFPRCAARRCRTGEGGRSSARFYTCATVSQSPASPSVPDPAALALRIRALAREAGFQRCGITGIELGEDEQYLRDWLAQGLYGSMEWM